MTHPAQLIATMANAMSRTIAANLSPNEALVLVVHLASDTLARLPPEQRGAGFRRLTRQIDAVLIATAAADA